MKRQSQNILWQEVVFQRPFELETIQDILTQIASTSPRGFLFWEVRGSGGFVRYLLGAEAWSSPKIREIITSHAAAEFYSVPEHTRAVMYLAKELKVSHPALSLRTDLSTSVIRAGLAAMALTPEGEEVVLQIVLGASSSPSSIPRTITDPAASWLQVALGTAEDATTEVRTSAREKASYHNFNVAIRLGASKANSFARLSGLLSALKTLEAAGIRISSADAKPGHLNSTHIPWHFPLKLSVKELAHFLLLPAGEEEMAGTVGLHPKLILPPTWYKEPTHAQDRTFALSLNAAEPLKLSISPRDSLEHTWLIGPTGSGKSTAMLNLALADIAAERSVLVIDPKADLVHDLLARIPSERHEDVVVIDPSDDTPVGFNPFALKNLTSAPLVADAILAVFSQIFSDNWGIRSADVLSAALLTLAEVDGASLLWLPPLLTNIAFRESITRNVKDRVALKPFWDNFESMKDSERRQEIAPTLNKLRQFLLRPGLRSVLGQSHPKFNLTDLFTKRRIVLVPLNKGTIGAESARLLGSLIVGMTWTLALSRANIAQEKRHIVNVYVDELQDYLALPTDFSDALSQARGLGLSLTVAHQYRKQLPPDIRAGIDANARNKIVFGLGIEDAKEVAAGATQLQAEDFTSLPRFQVYASFQQSGRSTGWIQGRTLPPAAPLQLPVELKALSMNRFGVPASTVEQDYLDLIQPSAQPDDPLDDTTIGRRRLP